MESDELKKVWASLDERLNKQEKLKESIIRKMLLAKSDKSLNRIINYDYFGIILCLGLIALLVWRMTSVYFGTFKTTLFLLIIAMLISGVIMNIIELFKLHKVDFSAPVDKNIRWVQKFNLSFKRQTLFACIVATILFILGLIAGLCSPNMELWRWVAIAVGICIGIVWGWWEYKHLIGKNINSILKSLDELKELEDE
ncbi:hypothetical protein FACS189421_13740 [Bacteroidia bacterium]|nr:hypothetical protein FACS189421_13740 [Bacteroidia bacterium]